MAENSGLGFVAVGFLRDINVFAPADKPGVVYRSAAVAYLGGTVKLSISESQVATFTPLKGRFVRITGSLDLTNPAKPKMTADTVVEVKV